MNLALLTIVPSQIHNKVYPIFTLAESLFFVSYFLLVIRKPYLRKVIYLLMAALIISSLAYYYYTYFILAHDPWLDSVPIGMETIVIFILSFLYFYEQMNDTTSLFIYNTPAFWGVLGILIYLSGSFFVYVFANQIEQSQLSKYWIITNISSIIKNIFFTIAIYIQASQSMKKPPRNYRLYPSN